MDPFAPPDHPPSSTSLGEDDGPWRVFAECVVPRWRLVAFPPGRCVVCAAPAETSVALSLSWVPPWTWWLALLVLVPFGAVLFGLLYLVQRRTAAVVAPLCGPHRRAHDVAAVAARLCACVAALSVFLAFVARSPWFLLLGLATLVAAGIAWRLEGVLGTARMDGEFAWVTGVHRAVVDPLPEF